MSIKPEEKIILQQQLDKCEMLYANILIDTYKEILGVLILDIRTNHRGFDIITTPVNLRSVMYFFQLHTLSLFEQLLEITCVDEPENELRFTLNYTLHSAEYHTSINIIIETDEVTPVPSVTLLFESADWLEREVYDLFGVFFEEHPDLRRLLTDYGFQGHPLRKDFPVTGFSEVYYNDVTKRLSYEPVELTQECRIWSVNETQDEIIYVKNTKMINSTPIIKS